MVRAGAAQRIPRDRETGAFLHTVPNVYREMLLQICREYPGLPDPRTLTMSEVRFFYAPLLPELKRQTTPPTTKPKRKPPPDAG